MRRRSSARVGRAAVSLPPPNAERSRVHRQVGNLIDGLTSMDRVKALKSLVQLTWTGALAMRAVRIAVMSVSAMRRWRCRLASSVPRCRCFAVPYARDVYRLEGGIPILLPLLSNAKPE